MFGYVTASMKELCHEQRERYGSVYCGICRRICEQSSWLARLCLSYDMAFLALLLMSLYEPEEQTGPLHCATHPLRRRDWVDNEYIRYAADMNVVLAYYNYRDDWEDDKKHYAKRMAKKLEPTLSAAGGRYPRQCEAISACIAELSALEKARCANPDEPAACFGRLMGELLAYREDMWVPTLRRMGLYLGRFIYLADAVVDYRRDRRRGKYNPFLALGEEEDWKRWQEYLVLDMGRCTDAYERLPLVQDKALLDNILYSGVWVNFRGKGAEARDET